MSSYLRIFSLSPGLRLLSYPFLVFFALGNSLFAAAAQSPVMWEVHLDWKAGSDPVKGYRVHRSTTSGGPYTDGTQSLITLPAYDDTTVLTGVTYYYVVSAVGSSGNESVYSNEAFAAVPNSTAPAQPPSSPSTPSGPVATTTFALNGSAAMNGTRLRLTTAGMNLAGSGWSTSPLNVQTFSNDFSFQMNNPTSSGTGNGIAFVMQNSGTHAIGPAGGGLGYGPDNIVHATASSRAPIGNSVAIKFDTVNNAGEGIDSTGIYKNGASPTMPAVTLGNGVNLRSGDVFQVHMNYDGTTLSMTITDTANPSQTFSTSWPVDIPGTVHGNTAYMGFTGATGTSVANQDVVTWTYSNSLSASKTPLIYRTSLLPVASSGPTFRTFTYAGFPDSTGTILDATAAKDNVTFTLNVPATGTYDIKLSYKQNINRGISQLTINGTGVGAPLDQYLPSEGYATFDYGNFTFPSAGKYSFKFTILGKNAKASGFSVSFDSLTLSPQ
jgi:hypothetical protein